MAEYLTDPNNPDLVGVADKGGVIRWVYKYDTEEIAWAENLGGAGEALPAIPPATAVSPLRPLLPTTTTVEGTGGAKSDTPGGLLAEQQNLELTRQGLSFALEKLSPELERLQSHNAQVEALQARIELYNKEAARLSSAPPGSIEQIVYYVAEEERKKLEAAIAESRATIRSFRAEDLTGQIEKYNDRLRRVGASAPLLDERIQSLTRTTLEPFERKTPTGESEGFDLVGAIQAGVDQTTLTLAGFAKADIANAALGARELTTAQDRFVNSQTGEYKIVSKAEQNKGGVLDALQEEGFAIETEGPRTPAQQQVVEDIAIQGLKNLAADTNNKQLTALLERESSTMRQLAEARKTAPERCEALQKAGRVAEDRVFAGALPDGTLLSLSKAEYASLPSEIQKRIETYPNSNPLELLDTSGRTPQEAFSRYQSLGLVSKTALFAGSNSKGEPLIALDQKGEEVAATTDLRNLMAVRRERENKPDAGLINAQEKIAALNGTDLKTLSASYTRGLQQGKALGILTQREQAQARIGGDAESMEAALFAVNVPGIIGRGVAEGIIATLTKGQTLAPKILKSLSKALASERGGAEVALMARSGSTSVILASAMGIGATGIVLRGIDEGTGQKLTEWINRVVSQHNVPSALEALKTARVISAITPAPIPRPISGQASPDALAKTPRLIGGLPPISGNRLSTGGRGQVAIKERPVFTLPEELIVPGKPAGLTAAQKKALQSLLDEVNRHRGAEDIPSQDTGEALEKVRTGSSLHAADLERLQVLSLSLAATAQSAVAGQSPQSPRPVGPAILGPVITTTPATGSQGVIIEVPDSLTSQEAKAGRQSIKASLPATVTTANIAALAAQVKATLPKTLTDAQVAAITASLRTTAELQAVSPRVAKGTKKVTPRQPYLLPSGSKLKPGVYPEKARWAQGVVLVTYNFRTGQATYTPNPGPSTSTPEKTFRIISTTTTKPRAHRLRLGFIDLLVGESRLGFRRNEQARVRQIGLRTRERIK